MTVLCMLAGDILSKECFLRETPLPKILSLFLITIFMLTWGGPKAISLRICQVNLLAVTLCLESKQIHTRILNL